MTETRYASLSGSLLARKGGAKPAMRPRNIASGAMLDDLGWNDMGYAPEQSPDHVPSSISALTPAPKAIRDDHVREEQVREDHVGEANAPEENRAPVPVVEQQRALADQYPQVEDELIEEQAEEPAEEPVVVVERPVADVVAMPKRETLINSRKAAFTLRLDSSRHLRLRLATAVTGRSAQQLVTAALDQFIESLPEVGSLAEQLPARSKRS